MNKSLLCSLFAAFVMAAPAEAQSLTTQEKTAITRALGAYTQGIRAGKIAIDTTIVNNDSLKIFLNSALQDIPIRQDNANAIVSTIRSFLPANLNKKKLQVLIDGQDIFSLIPNFYRPKAERRPAFHNTVTTPLVTRADRPYTPHNGLDGKHIAMWQSHGKYFELGANRWEWQRARLFESVEDKFTQSFVLPYLIPMLENAGAYVMTPRERDTNPYEVIVDNDGQKAKSPYTEQNGVNTWQQGEGTGFAYARATYQNFENPFTEGTYRQTTTVRKASQASTITWTPQILQERSYAVYVSYKTVEGSTTDAHYTVCHKGVETHFTVNQTMGGGTWVYLGTFNFGMGKGNYVKLTNVSHTDGKIVTADAVRFGGGMGNIARVASGDSTYLYTKGNTRSLGGLPRNEYQPSFTVKPMTSGYPRFLEGARYYMQWAGIPDSVYSPTQGRNDYTDDYRNRGIWVNYIAGGSKACPDVKGLNIPVALSFAFHSDAGTVKGDSIIGNLGIYQTSMYGGRFADGTSRDANRDLCDLVQSSITHDLRTQVEPKWTRRGMWNQRYFEAWTPRVPAMLLELMSHENFADMRYGLDPRFAFITSRAIYKGILRFLSSEYGYDYVVQPLPVNHFSALFNKKNEVELSWAPVADSLEATAMPDHYIVYKRIGNGDFDNGTVVKKNSFTCTIPTDVVVSFKVTALNKGGESFPSEVLSVGINSKATARPVLVINGFDRLSAPDDFVSADDAEAGFLADNDNGVSYQQLISYVGKMKEFRRAIPWTHDDAAGFGDSYGNYEGKIIAGNTFDYPALHGSSILNAGYSFCSMGRSALNTFEGKLPQALKPLTGEACQSAFSAIDLILGKQKQSKFGRPGLHPLSFKTFDETMQNFLTAYCKAGGAVFVSGSYVGTDLWQNPLNYPATNPYAEYFKKNEKTDKDFARNILKYQWREDRASNTGRVAYVASPLSEKNTTVRYYNVPNDKSYVVESPDAIDPADPSAYTIMRYPENNMSAGICFGGNATDRWRTCVLAFPFESVKLRKQRDNMMKQILTYLVEK